MLIELDIGELGNGCFNDDKSVIFHVPERKPYELKDIHEDELVIKGFYSSEIHLENISCRSIVIDTYATKLNIDHVDCEEMIVKQPILEIGSSNICHLTIKNE